MNSRPCPQSGERTPHGRPPDRPPCGPRQAQPGYRVGSLLYPCQAQPGPHLLVGLQEHGVAVQEARAGLVGGRRRPQPRVGRQDGLGEPARAPQRRRHCNVTHTSRPRRRGQRSVTHTSRPRRRRQRSVLPSQPRIARPCSRVNTATPLVRTRLLPLGSAHVATGFALRGAPGGPRGALARPRVHGLGGPVEAAVAARREREHDHARGRRLLAHAPRGQQHARRDVRAHRLVVVQVLQRARAPGSHVGLGLRAHGWRHRAR